MNYDSHFYLYAKGHYKTKDTLHDLKILQGAYCGIDPEDISTADVLGHLTALIWKHMNDRTFSDFCNHLLPDNAWKVCPKEDFGDPRLVMIHSCLAILRFVTVTEGDKILLELAAPDQHILPLRIDRTHEECAGCSKEKIFPPQCKGHIAGPSACGDFIEGDHTNVSTRAYNKKERGR